MVCNDDSMPAFQWLFQVCFLVAAMVWALAPPPRVFAQTDAQPAACGFPAAGRVVADATYTLTSDCVQTGALQFNGEVTINGGGYTISAASTYTDAGAMIEGITGSELTFNSVTIDAAGLGSTAAPTKVQISGTLTADDVTFKNSPTSVMLNIDGSATMTDVLFEDNYSSAFSGNGNGVALNIGQFGGAVTITNAVFRDNERGGAAVVIIPSTTGSLTTNGCLSFSGNMPRNVVGSWTDNSTGACSGTIGNGDDAVKAAPALMPCGLPASGNLDTSTTYSLRSHCNLSNSSSAIVWRISDGVNITIQGNGYRMSSDTGDTTRWIYQAAGGVLTLRDIIVDHTEFLTWGTVNVSDTTFNNTPDRIFYNVGSATFRNTLFSNITTARTANNAAVLVAARFYGDGDTTFTDSVFRGITSSGAPVLRTSGSSVITLNGCITFEGNTAANHAGNIVDNSTGECGPGDSVGVVTIPSDGLPVDLLSGKIPPLENCFQQLGEIGLVCRPLNAPEPIIHIWEVTAQSEGVYILSVAQSQIMARQSAGLAVSSSDGRVAVRVVGDSCVWRDERSRPRVTRAECIASELTRPAGGPISPERFTIVSVGPNIEGKVYSVVFDNGIAGHVIGTVDTLTGLPGVVAPTRTAVGSTASRPSNAAKYAPYVVPQAKNADGSLTHIVQPGDTLWAIANAYGFSPFRIANRNQLADGGRLLLPGQRIVILDAA